MPVGKDVRDGDGLYYVIREPAISKNEYIQLASKPGNVSVVFDCGDVVKVCLHDEAEHTEKHVNNNVIRGSENKKDTRKKHKSDTHSNIAMFGMLGSTETSDTHKTDEIKDKTQEGVKEDTVNTEALVEPMTDQDNQALNRVVDLLEVINNHKDNEKFVSSFLQYLDNNEDAIRIDITVGTNDVIQGTLYPLADIDPFNFRPDDVNGYGFNLGLIVFSYKIDNKQYTEVAVAILQNDSNSKHKDTETTIDLNSKFARKDSKKVSYDNQGYISAKKHAHGIVCDKQVSDRFMELLQESFHVLVITGYGDKFKARDLKRNELVEFIGNEDASGFAKLASNRREAKDSKAYDKLVRKHHFLVPSMFDAYNVANQYGQHLKDDNDNPRQGIYIANHVHKLHGSARHGSARSTLEDYIAKVNKYEQGNWMKAMQKGILVYEGNQDFRSGLSSQVRKIRHGGCNWLFGRGGHIQGGGDARAPLLSMVTSDTYEQHLAEKLHRRLEKGDHIDRLAEAMNTIITGPAVSQKENKVNDNKNGKDNKKHDDASDNTTTTQNTDNTQSHTSVIIDSESHTTTQNAQKDESDTPPRNTRRRKSAANAVKTISDDKPNTQHENKDSENQNNDKAKNEKHTESTEKKSDNNTNIGGILIANDNSRQHSETNTTQSSSDENVGPRKSAPAIAYLMDLELNNLSKEDAEKRDRLEKQRNELVRNASTNFNTLKSFKHALIHEHAIALVPHEYTHNKPYAQLVANFVLQKDLTLSQRQAYNNFVAQYPNHLTRHDTFKQVTVAKALECLRIAVNERHERYLAMVKSGEDFVAACERRIQSSKKMLESSKKQMLSPKITAQRKQRLANTVATLEKRIIAMERLVREVKDLQQRRLICWDPEQQEYKLPTADKVSTMEAEDADATIKRIGHMLDSYAEILYRDALIFYELGVIQYKPEKTKYDINNYTKLSLDKLDSVQDFARYLLLKYENKHFSKPSMHDTRYIAYS